MERLRDGVRGELRRLGPPDGAELAAIAAAWPEVAGETAARNAWPLRSGKDGTLHVATASSTWAFELARLAPELLARLRDRLGGAAPSALRFAPGPLPAAAEPPPEHRRRAVAVTDEDRDKAAALVAEAGDDSLRRLLWRAAAATLARARSDRRF